MKANLRPALLLTTASIVAGIVSFEASAQDAGAPSQATSPNPQTSKSSSDQPGGDIVVTARRRAESTLSVPISVNAFSSNTLATRGVIRTDDLQNATPALKLQPASGRRNDSVAEIRGIGADESLLTQDPAVGTYVNDVYRARPYGVNQAFYDIDNVQVLYGPQGTLFGRNSTSGAILINTKRPTHEFGAELDAGYGNFNRYEITGIVNLPVSETLAIRLAGQRIRSDGYAHDVTNDVRLGGKNDVGGRASILWNPSDRLENLTVASYYRGRDGATPVALYKVIPCTPNGALPFPYNYLAGSPIAGCLYSPQVNSVLGTGDLSGALASQQSRDLLHPAYDPGTKTFEHVTTESVSNTTSYKLTDNITLKNIFGFSHVRFHTSTDLDGSPVDLIYTNLLSTQHQLSDELQLQGQSERFNWTVGGLYFYERGEDAQDATQLGGFNPENDQLLNTIGINKSYAVFAQGTYKVLPKLSLTVGGRYSWDQRTAIYDNSTIRTGQPTQTCRFDTTLYPDCYIKLDKNFRKPTYTVSLDYKPDANTLLYVSTRQGYRAGGFNARAITAAQFVPFQPETVRDVEVGFKGNYSLGGDRRFRTSLAFYKTWYDNIQRTEAVVTGTTQTTIIANAASATIKGFEANAGITLVRGFDLSAFWGYVDGKYKKFDTGVAIIRNAPFPVSKNSVGVNLVLTPIDTPETGTVAVTTSYNYRSHYFSDYSAPFIYPTDRVPSQQLVNMTVAWNGIMGTKISAEAWVRNATNEHTILGILGLSQALGFSSVYVGEPRTYGLTLKYKFGDI